MKRKLLIFIIYTACYVTTIVASGKPCEYDTTGKKCDRGCCWKRNVPGYHCCSWAESVGDFPLALIGIATGLVVLTIVLCIVCRFVRCKGAQGQVISLSGQRNQRSRNEANVNMIPTAPVRSERRTGRHVQNRERRAQNMSRSNTNRTLSNTTRNTSHNHRTNPNASRTNRPNIQRVSRTAHSVPEQNPNSRYENSGYTGHVPDSSTHNSRGTRNVTPRNVETLPTVSENVDMLPAYSTIPPPQNADTSESQSSEQPPAYDSLLPSYDSLFNSKTNANKF